MQMPNDSLREKNPSDTAVTAMQQGQLGQLRLDMQVPSTLWLHFLALEVCVLDVHSARSYTDVVSTNSSMGPTHDHLQRMFP